MKNIINIFGAILLAFIFLPITYAVTVIAIRSDIREIGYKNLIKSVFMSRWQR
jgi:hypothetical protein